MRYLILLLLLCSACASQYPPTGGGLAAPTSSNATPDIFATQAVVNAMAQHYANQTSTAQVSTQNAKETENAAQAATVEQQVIERGLSISETQQAVIAMQAAADYSSTVAYISAQNATAVYNANMETQDALNRPGHETATAQWQKNEIDKGNFGFGAMVFSGVVFVVLLSAGVFLFFSAKADEVATRNYSERIAALNASVTVRQVNNLVLVFVAGELVGERDVGGDSAGVNNVIEHSPTQLPPGISDENQAAASLLLDTIAMQQRGGVAQNQLCSSYAFKQAGNKRWASGGVWERALGQMRSEFETSEQGTFLVGRWHSIAHLYAAMCRGFKPSPAPSGEAREEVDAG